MHMTAPDRRATVIGDGRQHSRVGGNAGALHLCVRLLILALSQVQRSLGCLHRIRRVSNLLAGDSAFRGRLPTPRKVMARTSKRSEEHTSELQALMRIS